MTPATEQELVEIRRDFEQFQKLGNGILKSAYLATSGRGFTEIKAIGLYDKSMLLCRESDNSFICYYQELINVPEKYEIVVSFNTDISSLSGKVIPVEFSIPKKEG